MIRQIRQRYLTLGYTYDNPIDQQRARLMLLMNAAIIAIVVVWLIVNTLSDMLNKQPIDPFTPFGVAVALICALVYWFIQTGRLAWGMWLFVGILLMAGILGVIFPSRTGPNLTSFPLLALAIPLMAAGILLPRSGALLVAFALGLAILAGSAAQNVKLADLPFTPVEVIRIDPLVSLFSLGVMLVFLLGFVGNLQEATSEALKEVKEREWVTEVGNRLSKVESQEGLLGQGLALISEHGEYLQTLLHLIDENGLLGLTLRSSGGQRATSERSNIRLNDTHIIAEVARTRQTATTASDDIPTRRSHMLVSASAAAAVPIIKDGILIGVLDVQKGQQSTFSKSEVSALALAAEEIGKRINEVEIIADMRRVVREQQASLERLQIQLQEIQQRERRSLSDTWGQYIQGRGAEAIGFNLDAGSAFNLVAASDLPETIYSTLKNGKLYIETVGTERVINVPINFRNTTLGAMSFSIPADQAVTERQIEMARVVAERLALALENTRLFEQSQSQALRERKASEIGNILIGSTDVRAVLNLAAEQFNEALGAVHTQIFIQPDILAEPLAQTEREGV